LPQHFRHSGCAWIPKAFFNRILLEFRLQRPYQIFIDAGGLGGPIYNRLICRS
jgi:hypothetical protein